MLIIVVEIMVSSTPNSTALTQSKNVNSNRTFLVVLKVVKIPKILKNLKVLISIFYRP